MRQLMDLMVEEDYTIFKESVRNPKKNTVNKSNIKYLSSQFLAIKSYMTLLSCVLE